MKTAFAQTFPQPVIPINEAQDCPANLRHTGYDDARMLISTRVRKSPYWHLSVRHGVRAYTVYNHMYHPRAYVPAAEGGLLKEHAYLTEGVTLWNVAVERQIQIKGPDALAFTNLLVTRDLAKMNKRGKPMTPPGKARYVILCNQEGGIINDPVLMRIAEDEFWLSISDSDVALWAHGVNAGYKYNVTIRELDVAPVQIQGPFSLPLMEKLVHKNIINKRVLDLKYYEICETKFNSLDVVISRTGFSGEVGYEVYLRDATKNADEMWDTIVNEGEEFGIKVIAPCHPRRIEAGILSYGGDMDLNTNPYELSEIGGFADKHVDLRKKDFIGKQALELIAATGTDRKLVGVTMGGDAIDWYNPDFWLVREESGEPIGYITSAFYSPKRDENIGFAMVPTEYSDLNTHLLVDLPGPPYPVDAWVTPVPFFDSGKRIPTGDSPDQS